jgi:acyl carrier protein
VLVHLDRKSESILPDAEATVQAETIVRKTIKSLLVRRGDGHLEIEASSTLTGDLGLDSLELAELSAVLEDELGYDPFSDGVVPETVADLIAYYDS